MEIFATDGIKQQIIIKKYIVLRLYKTNKLEGGWYQIRRFMGNFAQNNGNDKIFFQFDANKKLGLTNHDKRFSPI
jgi:hypothetical protein